MRYTESTLLGEPFLSPHFDRLMELYRQYRVYYRPTTNGSLLTEDKIERLSGVCDWLKCSFDAHNDELYRKLHLNGSFKTVVHNLKRFSQARQHMVPYPWFRIGIVMMRGNLHYLKDYADFVFQELGVDDIDIMALNYANESMLDEFFWDIPEEANRLIDEFIDHCIENRYRIRMAFARMPRIDGTWIEETSEERSRQIAASQRKADKAGYENCSEEVRNGDIFGNKEQLEDGYFFSNDLRITRAKAHDGSDVGVCEFFTRPFFKPPTREFDGKDWIKYESCGSCSTFVFGNLKEQSFADPYNFPMIQEVRKFLYSRYAFDKEEWMFACKNCLAVDQIYCQRRNGKFNVGVRFFPGENLYVYVVSENGNFDSRN